MKDVTLFILFARRPDPGAVKTRLARKIGDREAAAIYRAMLIDSIETLKAAGRPFAVAFTPPDAAPYFKELAAGRKNFPQEGNDLGEKMSRAFLSRFREGYKRVIVIGSDIVGLTPDILHRADAALKTHRAVIGPCRDGGYYLIGLNEFFPKLFTGIKWGSRTVLRDTLRRLRQKTVDFHLLPELIDFDRIEDLQAIIKQLPSLPGTNLARRIREWVNERHR